MFTKRSGKAERIDTGDYTPDEYETFLKEIRVVNRLTGDSRAMRRTLLREIGDSADVSVLDVGAGSGELLRTIARSRGRRNLRSNLVGLEMNPVSALSIIRDSSGFPEIRSVRGDALRMPFADRSFDFVFSSLFTHHLSDEQVIAVLKEMGRVARRGVFVIDLHRHRMAYAAYSVFCAAFRISRLVREDGLLSIKRGFRPPELEAYARLAGFDDHRVTRSMPFRLVLELRISS